MAMFATLSMFVSMQYRLLHGNQATSKLSVHDETMAQTCHLTMNERVKSRIQATLAGMSGLFYFISALAYANATGHIWNDIGCLLFTCVALTSACADGSIAEGTWLKQANTTWVRRVRTTDRWMATGAGAFALIPNLWPFQPFFSTVAILLVTASVIFPLQLARLTHHTKVWRWVVLQSLWHFMSAVAVAVLGPLSVNL
eukprot:gene204-3589_t